MFPYLRKRFQFKLIQKYYNLTCLRSTHINLGLTKNYNWLSGAVTFLAMQHIITPFLDLTCPHSYVGQTKRQVKSKAGAIECCKERNSTPLLMSVVTFHCGADTWSRKENL